MSEFKREERYIVLKLKDLHELSDDEYDLEQEVREFLTSYQLPTRAAVVVEPDWHNYELVWEDIQRIEESRPLLFDEQRDKLDVERAKAEKAKNTLHRVDEALRNQGPGKALRIVEQYFNELREMEESK